MKKTLPLLALMSISSGLIAFGQQTMSSVAAPQTQPTMLRSTGIPAGDALTVLPKGAILHVQINDLEKLAHDLNDLVVSAVPEKALPPSLQSIMAQPQPLLAFLGMNTVGAPLSAQLFSKMMGIDVTRPITMTVFMDQNAPAFVVTMPVADFVPITGMTINMTHPKSFEAEQIGSANCFHVVSGKPGIPRELFIICSDDRAYFCSSATLAGQLTSVSPASKMSVSDFIPSLVAKNQDADTIIAVDTMVMKQFLPMLEQQFMTIPPPMIENIRNSIPPTIKPMITSKLRSRYGFQSFDDLLDYVEVFALASYEMIAQGVVKHVRLSEGAGLALDIGGKYQSLKLVVRSDAITEAAATGSIPIAELKRAIDKLPGFRRLLMASGQVAAKKPSAFKKGWADLVRQKLAAKEISSKKVDIFLSTLCRIMPAQAVESIAPWTLTTFTGVQQGPDIGPQKKWSDLVRAATPTSFDNMVRATIMPVTGDILKQHYVSEARKAKQNLLAKQKINELMSKHPAFLTPDISLTTATLNHDITRLTELKTYTTALGFMGYDEHELVNRRFTLYRQDGDYLCIERGRKTPDWLASEAFGTSRRTRPSIDKLIDKAPTGIHTLHIGTSDDTAASILELAGVAEDTVHIELNTYLTSIIKALEAAPALQTSLLAKLASQMPEYVISANKDVATGNVYLVLPGNITYPRHKLVPSAKACFEEFIAKAGTTGGAAYCARTIPGQHEMLVLQNSEGLAMLIKSTVNSFYSQFMITPEGKANFQKLLRGPYDGPRESQMIFSNPALNPTIEAFQKQNLSIF